MQALQQLPGVGHLGTPQSITGILEGTAYDTLTQTGPYVWNQLDAYGRQQAEGLAPGEQPVAPGGIALGAARAGEELRLQHPGRMGPWHYGRRAARANARGNGRGPANTLAKSAAGEA